MPACATQEKITDTTALSNWILPVPSTDFRDFLDEVEKLAKFAPEILVAIEQDLDANAREKKKARLEDRRFYHNRTAQLPGLNIAEQDLLAANLILEVGRPRMSAYAVFIFLMLRGFLGSLSSKPAQRFLLESMSLYDFLESRGLKMPAVTTIVENVNVLSHATRELIFDQQISLILGEELDDFRKLTIDSTSVKANSCWPTDGKVLTGLLERAHGLGQKLHCFGLADFRTGHLPRWLEEMGRLEFRICLVSGKANSKGKMKKHYRQLLRRGEKAAAALMRELSALEQSLSMAALAPSRRVLFRRVVEQIRTDVADAKRVVEYAQARVFHGEKRPSTEKILSLSDGSAAYIKKGSRNPVIGYKPQLVRSEKGFVTSLIVPQGNAADSIKLVPAIRDSIERTGVIAQLVSTDDGYASANGRDEVLGMGVEDISISGAKGKKLTDPEDWDSQRHQDARRNRSAVESLMFTIKDGFEFGELGRRGIDAVRDELLEKVLAYNCSRIILLKKRRLREAALALAA